MNVRILYCFVFCACLATTTGWSTSALLGEDAYPKWSQLEKLFGKKKSSKQVQAIVKKWKLDEITKGPSGSFSPDNSSYSLMYENSRISTIVLDVLPPPKGYGEAHWTEYKEALPFGIKKADKKAEFEMRFGKSTSKTGTFFKNKKFEIWAHFREKDGALYELYISPLEKKTKKPNNAKKASKGKPVAPKALLNPGDTPNLPPQEK